MAITVNLDKATIGDLRLFERWQSGSYSVGELLDFLARIVETADQPLEEMPLTSLSEIMKAVSDATDAISGTDAKN